MKFLKFLSLGGLTYSINIGLTYALNNYLNSPIYLSYLVSILIITIINFTSSLKIIFKVDYSKIILYKYTILLLVFSLLNYLLVNSLVFVFGEELLYYFIFFITTFFFFLKFIVYDKFVFKQNNN